jgi:hypothetical protein
LEARIVRAKHSAGQIDAWNKRKLADDWHLAGYCETILIVHGGMLDRHRDIVVYQVIVGQLGNFDVLLVAIFGCEQRPELVGHVIFLYRTSVFWDAGLPALMVTNIAFFRNPNYHLPTDTIDTRDFTFMAQLVKSLEFALLELPPASAS